MKKRLTILMMAALAVGVLVPTVHAGFILELDDGVTTLTITDGQVGPPTDLNPAAGAITFVGSIGVWTLNVTTGLSKPALGSASDPHMDLNSIDVSSGAGGTLTIRLTDTDFSWAGPTATLESAIGGTIHEGTITFEQIVDENNTEFPASGVLETSLGPFGPDAFSGTATDAGLLSDTFSLTEVVEITHPPGDHSSSFDASSTIVPAPAALLLGMLGLSVAGLKLRKRV